MSTKTTQTIGQYTVDDLQRAFCRAMQRYYRRIRRQIQRNNAELIARGRAFEA